MNVKAFWIGSLRVGLVSTASVAALGAAHAQASPATIVPVAAVTQSESSSGPSDQPAANSVADQAPAAAANESSDAGSNAPQDGDIIVTGSRLEVSGYRQPTPVTVLGAEKLTRDNRTELISALAELPAVGPTGGISNSANSASISNNIAGQQLINLRNLGTGRTLTLFDGVRVAGGDLSLMPTSLVQRVDVVTGGASAAWGSDAVSGVVNVILNKTFEGLLVNVQGESNWGGYSQKAKGEVSLGVDIGSRAHLIVSGAYLYSPDRVIPTDTSWYKAQNLVNNPAYTTTNGQPRLIHADNVGLSTATQGGLITSGPLRGTQFLANGVPASFDFGNVTGNLSNGGTLNISVDNGIAQNVTVPYKGGQFFGYLSYDLGGGIEASLEVNYLKSEVRTTSQGYVRNSVLVKNDNPYLDAVTLGRMDAAGITSFTLGTINSNNVNVTDGKSLWGLSVGNYNATSTRTINRQVLSLSGPLSFLGDWKWNANLQRSEQHQHIFIGNNPIVARYDLATDPVRVTAANVGTSGLAVGSIACRSTLANPTNGCRPLNVLGINVADPAAMVYIHGTDTTSGSFSDLYTKQWTASAAMRGEPFSTWAGPVAMALGADFRRDQVVQTADPLQVARAYAVSNRQPFNGSQESIEGFAEVNIPLIADGIVKSLDVNAAGRLIHYNTSGQVVTWKFGATSQLNDDLRLRGTISRDIRAPTPVSLFATGATINISIPDPFNNNTVVNAVQITSGNPNLDPEKADTITVGVVATPSWLPGFSASVDYYSIDINKAFYTPGFAEIIPRCVGGEQAFCSLLTRNAAGVLTAVNSSPNNAQSEAAAGFDIQVDYRLPLGAGRLDISAMANYVTKAETRNQGRTIDYLNSLNIEYNGINQFRSVVSATYSQPQFSATVQARVIGAGKLSTSFKPGDVDDNHVPAKAYFDLRASYYADQDKRFQIYASVDNVLGSKPPIIPNPPTYPNPTLFIPARTELYDFLGTVFRAGVRAKF